jgi:hypothetical protein
VHAQIHVLSKQSHNNYQRNERGGGALAFSPTDYRVYFLDSLLEFKFKMIIFI